MENPTFALYPYHIVLAGCGAAIVLAYWLPRWLPGREPASSGLLILGGLAVFGLVPGMPASVSPIDRPRLWEIASEMAVIIALFGTGLRLDSVADWRKWKPAIRLLLVAMPLSIAAVAWGGWMIGMTLSGAVLLAAVLAPTDPVLAADVQVGRPREGGEHPVRYALTGEAGLNDGLAFPFVHLAILMATAGAAGGWVGKWLGFYVIYKIAVGGLCGLVAGWALGKMLFVFPRGNPLAGSGSGIVALAGVLLTYGTTELLEGYGFIAAFVMGLVLRRVETDHEYHSTLHSFAEALEYGITAILLVLIGGALPALWPYLYWPYVVLGAALIFVIRPATGLLSLAGVPFDNRQRLAVAFYGVRGIGSIYYLAYAGGKLDLPEEGTLWATVGFTILASTLVHGFTAGRAISDVTEKRRSIERH